MKNILGIFLLLGIINIASAEEVWSVGKSEVNGKPIVYKFMNGLPELSVRNKLPWLTVVSWKYDGSTNNGMPPKK